MTTTDSTVSDEAKNEKDENDINDVSDTKDVLVEEGEVKEGAAHKTGAAAATAATDRAAERPDGTARRKSERASNRSFLPILIVPGFMSSGLEILESELKPAWKGKRVWLNLQSLGIESMQFGKRLQPAKTPRQMGKVLKTDGSHNYRSMWIQHMRLQSDLKSEKDGVKVRAIPGLDGVDYLTPGALTELLSYVFGPAIRALEAAGYQRGVNLEAASYDWRLPPDEMEARDQYFTNTITMIEQLYARNNNTPVVVMCHSLGCKVGHYLLNFCLTAMGQEWLDQHVHTWMPVGGPHLGASKALRSVITGDKMGLETFLTTDEALGFGRSLGSGPWLFPSKIPESAPPNVYIKPHGILEVEFITPIHCGQFVDDREESDYPSHYNIVAGFGEKTTVMGAAQEPNKLMLTIPEKFLFCKLPFGEGESKRKEFVQFFLQEPGIAAKKALRTSTKNLNAGEEGNNQSKGPWTRCKTCAGYCLLRCLCKPVLYGVNALVSKLGGSTTLAMTSKIDISEVFESESVMKKVEFVHQEDVRSLVSFGNQRRSTTAMVRFRFNQFNPDRSKESTCDAIATGGGVHLEVRSNMLLGKEVRAVKSTSMAKVTKKIKKISSYLLRQRRYMPVCGNDMLVRCGLWEIQDGIKSHYDQNFFNPREFCSSSAPPVKRVMAIYGINLKTEVSAVYTRLSGAVESRNHTKRRFKLDRAAKLAPTERTKGYTIKGGIIFETNRTTQQISRPPPRQDNTSTRDVEVSFKNGQVCENGQVQETGTISAGETRQCSGDGTVPYYSLQHPRTWSDVCEVRIEEIDKAEHRDILADPRFHAVVIDYCTIKEPPVEPTS